MAELIVNQEKVTHKILMELIDLCPFNAIEDHSGDLYINSGCKMCRLCVKNSQGAIELKEEDDKPQVDKGAWRGITVYIDHFDGEIHPVSLELIGKARELAEVINHPVQALIMGEDIKILAEEVLHYGVDEVHIYEDKKLKDFKVENHTAVFEDFINKVKPSSILVGATTLGRSLAPRVAARFKTGLTADCTILKMKENTDLVQIRPAFGGNIMAQIVTENHRPQFCTARYKVFDAPEKGEKFGKIITQDIDSNLLNSKINVLNVFKKEKEESISDAEVIIAIGRGVQKEEDLNFINELADLVGGQIAVTRPLIENGWFDAKKQVGLSGRTVKPKLIFAIGIHGAVQFTAGMENSETIIAINKDENAPIFNCAHIGVVGDLYKVVPELIEKIKGGELNV